MSHNWACQPSRIKESTNYFCKLLIRAYRLFTWSLLQRLSTSSIYHFSSFSLILKIRGRTFGRKTIAKDKIRIWKVLILLFPREIEWRICYIDSLCSIEINNCHGSLKLSTPWDASPYNFFQSCLSLNTITISRE